MRSISKLLLIGLLLAVISCTTTQPMETSLQTSKQSAQSMSPVVSQVALDPINKLHTDVLDEINKQRLYHEIPILSLSDALGESAFLRAGELPRLFSHMRPSGGECFSAITVPYVFAGENISEGHFSPTDVVQAWMSSPQHKANILNPKYEQCGIASVEVDNIRYWCLMLIQPS